jgi:DNA-directed RNA polymerase specialized sigma24 family protein
MCDADDFDTFYATSSRRVVAHVAMMVGSRAEAEDSVAEAYLSACTISPGSTSPRSIRRPESRPAR